MEEKNKIKLVVATVVGVIAIILILILNPFVKVDATERGLVFNWGALSDKVLDPGIHFRMPVKQKIKTVSIQPIKIDHQVVVGNDGAITKDNQTVGADLTIFYVYKKDQLIPMWENFGEEKIQSIMGSTLRESFKSTLGGYDIFKLPVSQDEIQQKVFGVLKEKMAEYPIEVTELKIVNYDWSDQFDAQITETMNRAQQVKQKEQELLITEQEAQKKVKEAEAEKTALITKAEGEKTAAGLMAEAKALEGEGIKKYNQSVQANMDLEIRLRQLEIEKLRVEKWNGQYVPENNYSPIPLQNGGLLGK